jgi:hypothetical protein
VAIQQLNRIGGGRKNDIEEAIIEITRLKALLEDAVADFERIATWDFDIMGDCVADAQSVARQAIRKIGEMK